jgi:glycosyltransferase involved in cell wall biosynthesis
MKIAIASLGDPRSVKTWSGIPAHIVPALEKRGHEVISINLKTPPEPWYFDWLRRLYYRLQKKWFMSSVEKVILKAIGQQFDKEVANIKPDCVLAIHGDFLAYTTFIQPSVLVHDTTFASLLNYYNGFTGLTKRSINAGNTMYQRALDRVDAAVFSADWASQSALIDYGIQSSKVFTVPLGANLEQAPDAEKVNIWIADRVRNEVCNLLFLGVDWIRKGGPDILHMIKYLNGKGIKTVLNVVGVTPEIPEDYKAYVNVIGFLRKSVPKESVQLSNLLETSSALILPSIAECYGCVFCEANAYGLPALGRNTGGIPEIIKEGVNGLMLGSHESPEAFANRWSDIWLNKESYKEMANQSRIEYDNRLNYDVFAHTLEQIMSKVIDDRK